MGSQRVGHDLVTKQQLYVHTKDILLPQGDGVQDCLLPLFLPWMMQVDVSLGCYSSDKFPIKLSSSKPSPGLVGAGEPQLACAWLTHPHLAPGWTVHGEWCQLCTQACGGKAAQFPVFLVRAPPLLPQQWKTLLLSSPLSNGTYMPLECLLLI